MEEKLTAYEQLLKTKGIATEARVFTFGDEQEYCLVFDHFGAVADWLNLVPLSQKDVDQHLELIGMPLYDNGVWSACLRVYLGGDFIDKHTNAILSASTVH